MSTDISETNKLLIRYRGLVENEIVRNRPTLSRWMNLKRDPFPAPIRLGPNSIAWRMADVLAWIERRANAGKGAA